MYPDDEAPHATLSIRLLTVYTQNKKTKNTPL